MRRLISIAAIFFLIVFFAYKIFANAKWDGKRRFNFIVDGDPLYLVSIEPVTRQAQVLAIPKNVILEVPYEYGTYPAGAVYGLGKLDQKRGGGKLLSKSIENTFAVVVEGFFAGKKDSYSLKYSDLSSHKKKYFSVGGFIPSVFLFQRLSSDISYDLSLSDVFRIWSTLRKLRIDQISITDLEKANVLNHQKQPDGTEVQLINYDLLDLFNLTKFQDTEVRDEKISVEVVNATGREKVATQFTRILNNLGANVVSKSTGGVTEKELCSLYISDSKFSSSIIVKRLKNFYQCKLDEQKNNGISDIKVVLGEEYLK